MHARPIYMYKYLVPVLSGVFDRMNICMKNIIEHFVCSADAVLSLPVVVFI